MKPTCLSHRQCNMNNEKFRQITKDRIFCTQDNWLHKIQEGKILGDIHKSITSEAFEGVPYSTCYWYNLHCNLASGLGPGLQESCELITKTTKKCKENNQEPQHICREKLKKFELFSLSTGGGEKVTVFNTNTIKIFENTKRITCFSCLLLTEQKVVNLNCNKEYLDLTLGKLCWLRTAHYHVPFSLWSLDFHHIDYFQGCLPLWPLTTLPVALCPPKTSSIWRYG